MEPSLGLEGRSSVFLGVNEKRSRGFCSPGHLTNRLGHRDNGAPPKKNQKRNDEATQRLSKAGSHSFPRAEGCAGGGRGTGAHQRGGGTTRVCRAGAAGQRCHWRQRDGNPGLRLFPPSSLVPDLPRGQRAGRSGTHRPCGSRERTEEGSKERGSQQRGLDGSSLLMD